MAFAQNLSIGSDNSFAIQPTLLSSLSLRGRGHLCTLIVNQGVLDHMVLIMLIWEDRYIIVAAVTFADWIPQATHDRENMSKHRGAQQTSN